MQFSEIPGLPETKEKLINAVKFNHLAHALLFHGPEGSANLTLALALATYLYCENPSDTDSCGACSPCQRMSRLVMPDLNFAFPVIAKSKDDDKVEEEEDDKVDVLTNWRKFAIDYPYGNVHDFIYFNGFEKKQLNISKASARKMIQALSLMSFEGGYKIMLIWAPEFLHPSAANALLKIIEEPPAKTIFMLVTSQADQLLTTILSRTQKILVRAFTDEEIKAHLIDTEMSDSKSADQIAMLADGNLREAYRMIDQVEDVQVTQIRNWFRFCVSKDLKEIFDLADWFHKEPKESQKSLMLTGLNVTREILLKNFDLDSLLRTTDEDRTFIDKISKNVLNEDHAVKLYESFNQAHYHLERNGNAKMIFTDLSMDILVMMAQKKQ
ncbi:ATP-binding protein [Algoriphagus sp.]|uniref:DNA polymerase III subunit n=1 Tax=Algoriphagus sp. TaxID=1872435 RepID=UPI00391A98F8